MNRIPETISEWVLRGRWHASAALTFCFSLAIFLPYFPIGGMAMLAASALIILLALQVGSRGTVEVIVIGAAAVALMMLNPSFAVLVLTSSFPPWIVGAALRWTGSLRGVNWVLFGFGAVLVATAIFATPGADAALYWSAEIQKTLGRISMPQGQVVDAATLKQVASILPGMMVSMLLILWLAAMQVARWLQSGYTEDHSMTGERFVDWDLPGPFLPVLAGAFLLAGLASANWALLGMNLALVLGFLFLFQGLALVHAFFAVRQWPWQGILVFYVFLTLFFYLAFVVMGLGIADKALNLRQRLRQG